MTADLLGVRRVYRNLASPIFGYFFGVPLAAVTFLCAISTAADLGNPAGHTTSNLVITGIAGLLTVIPWCLCVRPAVIADEIGVTVRNPCRTVTTQWGAIERFDVADRLHVHRKDGKTIRARSVRRSDRATKVARLFGSTSVASAIYNVAAFAHNVENDLNARLKTYLANEEQAHQQIVTSQATSRVEVGDGQPAR